MPVTAPAAGKANSSAAPAPVVRNPFVRAAFQHREPFYDQTFTLGSSAVAVSPIDVVPYGFMRHVVIEVAASGGAAGLNNAVAAGDAPYSILQNLTLQDVNGRPIFGPLPGYMAYLANLLGGYVWSSDPADLPGAVKMDTDGDFTFQIRIPIEITEKDAVGSLPNMVSSATYKVGFNIAPASQVYTTPPDTLPDVRIRMWLEAWSQPASADVRGVPNTTEPPFVGTTQFWSVASFPINAGEQTVRLTRLGNLIRNLLFVFYDDSATPVRSTAEFPAQIRFEWDGRIIDNISRTLWHNTMFERSGITPPDGVFHFDYTHDGDGHLGEENRHLYLPTIQGTRLELSGSFGGAGTLYVVTNDVAPVAPTITEPVA